MFNLLYNSIDFTTIAKIDLQIAKVAPKILFYATLDRWIKKSYNYSNKLEKRLKMNREKNLKRVGVYTENEYLFQKIRLELRDDFEVAPLSSASKRDCEIYLVDGDFPHSEDTRGLTMKREGGDIPLPFRIGELREILSESDKAYLYPIPDQKAVRVGSGAVRLTELEYALFDLLFSAGGEYVSREEILERIWEGRADKGIINVYVHYLREKLEADGEKIILSSRNYGYKINEKYLGGKKDA